MIVIIIIQHLTSMSTFFASSNDWIISFACVFSASILAWEAEHQRSDLTLKILKEKAGRVQYLQPPEGGRREPGPRGVWLSLRGRGPFTFAHRRDRTDGAPELRRALPAVWASLHICSALLKTPARAESCYLLWLCLQRATGRAGRGLQWILSIILSMCKKAKCAAVLDFNIKAGLHTVWTPLEEQTRSLHADQAPLFG